MTDKEVIAMLEEKLEEDKHFAEENALRDLAYVIERFCGGKIQFSIDDISRVWVRLEIRRTHCDGIITYVARIRDDDEDRD